LQSNVQAQESPARELPLQATPHRVPRRRCTRARRPRDRCGLHGRAAARAIRLV